MMDEDRIKRTAPLLTYFRAYHAVHDAPKIFDDFLAYHMLTEQERSFFDRQFTTAVGIIDPERGEACPDESTALAWFMRAIAPLSLATSRARYTEDLLEKAVNDGVRQYLIMGAGMDTFAFRCPDLVKRIQVFEIDHPATQAHKRSRIAEIGWEEPAHLHFVPVDFSRESPDAALERASYDRNSPSFFSWLGVTYYLRLEAVIATLRAIAALALPGSTIIFDYLDRGVFSSGGASRSIRVGMEYLRNIGEPMITGFDPDTLAEVLAGLGFRLEENLSPSDIEMRFFRDRTDGYHAYEHVHFARAVVE